MGAVAFATNTDSLWFLALEFVICSGEAESPTPYMALISVPSTFLLAHLNSMLGALNDRAGLRAARSDAESVDVLRSGHSGSMPKAHLRSGSYVRAHLRGLSYGSASPPSTSSPLRTPPLNAGFTLPGGPAGVGKGGWPAPSYPPSSVSSIFVPTHQVTLPDNNVWYQVLTTSRRPLKYRLPMLR